MRIDREGRRHCDVRLFCGIGPSSCTAGSSVPGAGTNCQRPIRQVRSTQKVSYYEQLKINNAQLKVEKHLAKDIMACKSSWRMFDL